MNFLSLPFLIPILTVFAVMAYPLYLAVVIPAMAAVAFFTKDLAHLPKVARVRALWHSAKLIAKIRLKEYVRGIVKVSKLIGVWAVSAAVFLGVALPGAAVGVLLGIGKWLVESYWVFMKETMTAVDDKLDDIAIGSLERATESVRW